ncbi:hypothetical protein E0Z10_g94 [Xylaria hypoxylon]|uniref:Rhodopsin domain-containing protein n=1 Tax=Xylaria hypoxylon TaxID=37992 RepID=A0A4Z0YXR5_9PEZI|nr:hypothetical protein E0Z10_g94 [Xylaria hypoxylon]
MGALVLFFLGISSQIYAFYLPIFFQSVQGVSTTQSGVQYIALVVPQIVNLVVTGGFVSTWGFYYPYIVSGVSIATVGAGLLTTVGPLTPTVKCAAFMVITGIGTGMAHQLPYTAVQAVLDYCGLFVSALGGALGLTIGQNLLISKLRMAVPAYTDAVSPDLVITAGASGLSDISPTPSVLDALRLAYSAAIHDTLILALAATALSVLPSLSIERLNIKTIANDRSGEAVVAEEKSPAEVRTIFIREILYSPGITLLKLSILWFYYQLFSVNTTLRRMIIATAVICVLWLVATTLDIALECMPIRAFWETFISPEYCLENLPVLLGNELSNFFIDVAILCIPARAVWQLQLSPAKKAPIMGIFLLGGLVCVFSILRLVVIWHSPYAYENGEFIPLIDVLFLKLMSLQISLAWLSSGQNYS